MRIDHADAGSIKLVCRYELQQARIIHKVGSGQTQIWKRYWIRRSLRIWPLYYLAIIVVTVGSLILSLPTGGLPWLATFTYNWVSWSEPNQFLSHFWSMCAEEQLYIMIPILVFVAAGAAGMAAAVELDLGPLGESNALYAALVSHGGEALVVPALNRDGDCLSDMVLQLFGSIAGAESQLLAFDEDFRASAVMAEAPHGTAPTLQGKNVANPLAMILAGASVLPYMGDQAAATASRAIYEGALEAISDDVRTADLGRVRRSRGAGAR